MDWNVGETFLGTTLIKPNGISETLVCVWCLTLSRHRHVLCLYIQALLC